MRFSQQAYSQLESMTPLSVNLVLDTFGGNGTGMAAISQDIVEQITASAEGSDTATGKTVMRCSISCLCCWCKYLCMHGDIVAC